MAIAGTTEAFGVNGMDQIVGRSLSNGIEHGFLDSGGTYTALDAPLATNGTIAFGINAAGQIVGYDNDGGSCGVYATSVARRVLRT